MKTDKLIVIVVLGVIILGLAVVIYPKMKDTAEDEIAEQKTEQTTEATTEISLEDFTVAESDLEPDETLKGYMQELGDACDKYYINEFENGKHIVSLYSFLYDYSEKKDVTVDTLKDGGYYNYPDVLKNAAIHYFVPEKVKQFIPDYDEDMKLKIFTAIPVKGGVLLHSTEHEDSIISADDYKELMYAHVVSSEVINPKQGSEEFEAIKTAVLDKIEGEYDIKHIACNDKYAVLVIGMLNDVSDIREYLLIKENGKWLVEDDGIAEETSTAMFLNENYFDCDLSLLPVYNIRDYGEIKTDLSKFITSFVNNGYITADDKITYQCGAYNCAYFEFESGTKIVGVVEDEQLKVEKVDDAQQAVVYMVKKCGDVPAPIFVIKMGDYMIK